MPGADIISALPDEMIQEILSRLPAQYAVRTSVLARRWRHLWRSTTGLRLVGRDGVGPVGDLLKFVDNLLKLREKRSDILTLEIKLSEFEGPDMPDVSMWIDSALMCKLRSLTLHTHYTEFLYLDDTRIASPHIRTVDLVGVYLRGTFLDFASCPALENLKMHECHISIPKISSGSLKHLSITGCLCDTHRRLHVSAPGLVSLKLDGFSGLTPFFENMVLLETACVTLGSDRTDICLNYAPSFVFCGADSACRNCKNCRRDIVLLGAISSARHLKLISVFPNFTFARDLEHRPIFSNLNTLLLNEYWCEAAGCGRLAYVLKNSPVLEKLTLELFSKGPNYKLEMKGSYRTMERPSGISEHLKIVQVKFNMVNMRILEVLRFLQAFNIRFSSKKG